ncbi:MAG: carbamate kinase [bacterium]|nr:carbamate kinase [bacterium]
MSKRVVVIALGGNAIMPARGRGTLARQFANVDVTARQIADLVKHHYKVVITHGNGPQVGSLLIQQEQVEELVAGQPLDICDAMTQGQIGYMLQNRLWYWFQRYCGREIPVCTVVTQVEVESGSEGLLRATKPIGPYYTKAEAEELARRRGYVIKEVAAHAARGWRRVVASPRPVAIVESQAIMQLLDNHVVVIACGGGGIPVVRDERGMLRGVEAVVDKDWTACVLARLVDADYLLILTDVEKVALNWGTEEEKAINRMTVREARRYWRAGHFPEGSMGPKVMAAVEFVETTGQAAVITSLGRARKALRGETGTWIVP